MAEVRSDGEIGDARKFIYTAANGTIHRFIVSNAEIAGQGGNVEIPLRRHVDRIEARLKRNLSWVV